MLTTRLRAAALALSLSATLPAATAAAQGAGAPGDGFTKWVQGVVNYRRYRGGDVTACEQTNTVGALYNQCYIAGVSKPVPKAGSGLAVASVGDDGALHAAAYVDWYVSDIDITVARAFATASYSDRLTFGSVVPASLVFDLHLDGTVVGGESYGDLTLNGVGNLGDGFLHLGPNDGGVTSGSFTVGIWNQAPGATYDFTLSLGVYAQGSGLLAGYSNRADFLNTAYVNGLRALDAAGNDITAAVIAGGVRSASGFGYGGFAGGAVTTTPEPATVALLGAGLLALGGAAARRRRPS